MHASGSRSFFGPTQLWPWFCDTSLRDGTKGTSQWERFLDRSSSAPCSVRPVTRRPEVHKAFHRPIKGAFGQLKKGGLACRRLNATRRCCQNAHACPDVDTGPIFLPKCEPCFVCGGK